MKEKIKNLFIIILPLLGGILVSLLTNSKNYKVINKPPLSPPSIVFPIVWTILYILMGISFYLTNKEMDNDQINKSFIMQLIINYIWPFIFFNLKLYAISALWLVLLIVWVFRMTIELYKSKKIAGLLQIPYIIWLLFALYLNIGVAILN